MQCPACRQDNPLHAKFCLECGARMTLSCGKCRAELPPAAKFCLECGERVSPASGASGSPAPDSYTPKHLAERIINSKAALEGERKQVTVLFADLKGSMELLADRDPEEARKILDPVLEHMMEAVHQYEGTVNQVMGDGIMALFGAPVAHEDHAVRACYAALRMQQSVKNYAEGVRRIEGIPIRIRVGLNSGDVVVRAIGSDLHMDYTAVGQTTHLAARMEQIADPGTIAMTPATLALAEGFVEVRSLGAMAVKGLSEPVNVAELTGVSATRSRLQAVAARGLTKFVGRAAELTQLHEALELAKSSRGQVVGMVGEPGVGKSRLLWEFTHSHQTADCLVLEGASVSYGKATPYLPVIDLLKSYFGVEPRDDDRKIRDRITGQLLALDRAFETLLSPFLALLDVTVDDDEWQRLEPPQRRLRTLNGIKRLLIRESHNQPVVVVFEDLHWIDGETRAFLEALAESIPTARILLLVNYRPEYEHRWGSRTYYRQLRLDSLETATAHQLLDDLLGERVAELKHMLIQRTDGNPFFIEEIVRSLVETGVLTGDRGHYSLTSSLHSLPIPPTAQAVVAARIDRLDPVEKGVLQAAAVVGKDVPVALLERIVDHAPDVLTHRLAALQAAEFLYEARLFPDVEYTFKHALTHDVTYRGLLHDQRRKLHGKIVDAVLEGSSSRLDEWLSTLAHHAFAAERWDQAAALARQGSLRAFARSAYTESAIAAQQALDALEHLPITNETTALAIDTRMDLRDALFVTGQIEKSLKTLEEAKVLAEGCGDADRLAKVLAVMANAQWIVGNAVAAVAVGERARIVAESSGDLASTVRARVGLGQAYTSLGRYTDAERVLRRNVEMLTGPLAMEGFGRRNLVSVTSRCWLAWSLAWLGRFDEALKIAADSPYNALDTNEAWTVLSARWGTTIPSIIRGDFHRVIQPLHETLAFCEATGISVWRPGFLAGLGRACAGTGMIERGLQLLREAVDTARVSNRVVDAMALCWLADAELLAGNVDVALGVATRGIDVARQRDERGNLAELLVVLTSIYERAGDSDAAFATLAEAAATVSELAIRPLVAHCHFAYARLYGTRARAAEASEQRASAIALYREMGMTYWLEKAEREMRLLSA